MEIRNAKQKDISQLVRLHLANSHANEVSVILGEAFVKNFYKLCIEDPDVIIKVLAKNNEKVMGVSVIFFRYSGFYSKYKSIAIRLFPVYLLRVALNWKKLFTIFKTVVAQKNIYPSVIKDIDTFDKYVGQIIFDREAISIPNGLKLFYKMYSDNISLLSENSCSGMWGSCRVSNRSAIRISKSMGMIEFDRISSFPEDIVILVAMGKNQKVNLMMKLLIEKLAELTEEDIAAVTPDKSLTELAAWDSLAKVSFLAMALTEFGVELDGPDLENAESVQDLYQLILDAKNANE